MPQHSFTITGNVINDPTFKTLGDKAVFKARVAASRAVKGDGDSWQNFDQLFLSVECWNELARNCNGAVFRGIGVIITGTLITHEWTDDAGQKQSRIVLRAHHIGVDLNRHKVQPVSLVPISNPSQKQDESNKRESAEDKVIDGEHKDLAAVGIATAGTEARADVKTDDGVPF